MAVRLLLAPITSSAYDDATWYQATTLGWHGLGLYQIPGFSYPPLWGYWLASIGRIARLLGLPISSFGVSNSMFRSLTAQVQIFSGTITSPWFNLAFKLPLILSDLAVAYLIWHLAGHFGASDKKRGWLVAFWFLSPAVIYGSAVHGAFNTLIALEILGAVVCWQRRAYACTAAVLVAGVLTKVSPAFVIPIFVVAILCRSRSQGLDWRGLGRFCVCGAATLFLLVSPMVATGEVGAMLHNVFARTSAAATSVGGFSWLGANAMSRFNWLTAWASGPGEWIHSGSEVFDVVVSIGTCSIWVTRRERRDLRLLCMLITVVLIMILVFGPLTQPQYVIWLLPLLILLSTSSRVILATTVSLSIAVLGYVLSVLGPMALLSPLAVYTHLVSVSSIASSVRSITSGPAFLGPTTSKEFIAFSWMVAFPALIVTLVALGGSQVSFAMTPKFHLSRRSPARIRTKVVARSRKASIPGLLLAATSNTASRSGLNWSFRYRVSA